MTTSQSCQKGHCWCWQTTRGQRYCCRCGEAYAAVVTPSVATSGTDLPKPLCRCDPGVCLLHPSLTTCGMRTPGSSSYDLIPLYELQQRQDAERIATLTKELERLKVTEEMLRSLASDVRTALAPEYAHAVDDAQGDISVNTAMQVAVRQREDNHADQITDLTDELERLKGPHPKPRGGTR